MRRDFGVDSTVIPNGVDVDRFANAEPEERDRPYLLTVGRLEEYKGVQHVIRAMPELEKYDLLVAGSGPYREELERIAAEKGVADRVEFLGYVDDSRLPGLYAGADVYVTMSGFEAYGMTVAEALAAGTQTVVRSAAALSDWAGTTGVTAVSDMFPGSIAAAVEDTVGTSPAVDVLTWEGVTDYEEALYCQD